MKVAILVGSENDIEKMSACSTLLNRFSIECETHVMSAHRNPERVTRFASSARENGFGVIVCGAGMAAHLAGAVAALTTLPVIGVPISVGGLGGIDAMWSTVQMPRGVPVATVAIDGSANAGYLAASILSVTDETIAAKLDDHREKQKQ